MINDKLITALLAILLALGGWNLSQTFKLSNEMTEIKIKVEQIEEVIGKSLKKNKRKNKKKKQD
jgi:outer membrane lipopolysaccharide assembly protein LptE/RlpB